MIAANSNAQPFARIEARGVVVARGGRPIATLPDLVLGAGESVALVGPSGTGKTTVLMALAGVTPPFQGTIALSGVDLWKMTASARDRFRGGHVGMVFQTFHLVDALSVRGNLELAAQCAKVAFDPTHGAALAHALGIDDLLDRAIPTLSQGQVQRVAVARALVNKPGLVLADEPTAALDDGNALGLMALLQKMARQFGTALIVATHDRRVMDGLDRVIMPETMIGEPS